ncbi:MAG: universal stress protein [Planctomycetia bacterium]|nr:universal stress protein [Planctomycetia bacterium]
MRLLQKILLATDHRPASKEATATAARIAKAFGGRVFLLHVVSDATPAPIVLPFRREIAESTQRGYLAQLEADDVELAESTIVYGSPAARIVRKAEELDADLVVIGAGKRSEGDGFVAGPVAEAVMQHSRQPVLAVLPGGPAAAFRTIVCPVDGSAVSRRGLTNAIRLAKAFGGRLIVLTVIPELSWLGATVETGVFIGAKKQHEANWRQDLAEFMQSMNFAGVNFSQDVRSGDPEREIARAAREHGADVIVMGATGRSGLAEMLMGSVTRGVLQGLPCSLLTVQDEDVLLRELSDEEVRTGELLYAEAKALLETGAYEAALAKLDQALARNPLHVPALEARAVACEKTGQHSRAERCRRHAQALRQAVG